MHSGEVEKLVKEAERALNNAYAPYSNYKVASALLCKDGRVFTGVNVENASYGLTMCAERVSVFKAVSEGCKEFTAIAIVSEDSSIPPFPCGACRQVLAEFGLDLIVIVKTKDGIIQKTLKELLPYSFELSK